MTTTTDERALLALLAAIRANPDDDAVRLVYADYLEEDGYSPRAVLIRLQCKAAALERDGHGDNCPLLARMRESAKKNAGGQMFPKCGVCEDLQYFQFQADEIVATHPDWRPECPVCDGSTRVANESYGERRCRVCSRTGRIGIFRRGFLHEVTVPRMADVLEPKACLRWDRVPHPTRCPGCHGRGYNGYEPTKWATDLFRDPHMCAGLRRVACGDKRPYWNGLGYAFYNAQRSHPSLDVPESAVLPPLVFRAFEAVVKEMIAANSENDPHRNENRFAGFAKPVETNDALAEGLCATLREEWAKQQGEQKS